MIHKAVIPAAGMGTRLLPATKEQPKEMLRVFCEFQNDVIVKPTLQVIFENIYSSGIREFCFITGRTKRAIEDHFVPHNNPCIKKQIKPLDDFHEILNKSRIYWINQHEPHGFGDAVLHAKHFINNENFLVHAGDTILSAKNINILSRLFDIHEKYRPDATIIIHRPKDIQNFGVAETTIISEGVHKVLGIEEKPEHPKTDLAVLPVYAFNPIIFKALENTKSDKKGELQVVDAIQLMINWGLEVIAMELGTEEIRLDIGNPQSYKEALSYVIPEAKL